MVNNPELMRCEYLGHLCLKGNYTHGCLRSHQHGGNSVGFEDCIVLTEIVVASDPKTEYLQFKEWTAANLEYYPYFKQAVAIYSDDYNPIDLIPQAREVDKCLKESIASVSSSYAACYHCQLGYYPQSEVSSSDVYLNSDTDNASLPNLKFTCVQRCKDGKFVQIYPPSELDNQTIFGIARMECTDCDQSCRLCLGEGPKMCTICKMGYDLEISDSQLGVGECKAQAPKYLETVELEVTGDRLNAPISDYHFPSLISAMKFAYRLHWKLGASKILIYMKFGVTHYVFPKDVVAVGGNLIDNQHMVGSNYSLYLLPEGCSINVPCDSRVTIINKIGALLKLYSPFGGSLTVKNLIIESLDSVLEGKFFKKCVQPYYYPKQTLQNYHSSNAQYWQKCLSHHQSNSMFIVRDDYSIPGTKDCLNAEALCCKIDEKSTIITCTDSESRNLKPRFHKFNACFTKPIGGALVQITVFNEGRQYNQISANQLSMVLIENCEFRNFFYEMSSLVHIPHNPTSPQLTFQKPRVNITLVGNRFDKFTTCGSIIAHSEPITALSSYTMNTYGVKGYEYYHIERQLASKSYFDRYSSLKAVKMNTTPTVVNNTLGQSDEQSQAGQDIPNDSILDQQESDSVEGAQSEAMDYVSYITLYRNKFLHLNFLKRKEAEFKFYSEREESSLVRVNEESLSTQGFVVDIYSELTDSKVIVEFNQFEAIIQEFGYMQNARYFYNYCLDVDQTQWDYLYQNIFSSYIPYDPYFQLGALLSIRKAVGGLIIVHGNTFHNISTTGPVIHFTEAVDSFNSTVILSRNDFNLLHGTMSTNVIHLSKSYVNQFIISPFLAFTDPFGQSAQQSSLFLALKRKMFSGGYLIKENNFTEITGCPTVGSGIMYLAMGATSTINDKTTERGIFKEDGDPFSSDDMTSQSLSLLSEDQTLFTNTTRLVDYAPLGGATYLKTQSACIQGNRYVNVSMGADQLLDSVSYAGVLLKFVSIMVVETSDEYYENVGAYTDEFAIIVQGKIYQRTVPKVSYKGLFSLQGSFYSMHLSTSLIYATQLNLLEVRGKNTFKNIWLVDFNKAMQKDQGQALLLKVTNASGYVYFGGATVEDCVGFLNKYTLERFALWNPATWSLDLASANNEDIPYGAGSPLILAQSSDNFIKNITLENLSLSGLYFRAVLDTSVLNKSPAILSIIPPTSSQVTDENEKGISDLMVLRNIGMTNLTYEQASHYFELKGKQVNADNLTALNIGNHDFLSQSEWSQFKVLSRKFRLTPGSNSLIQMKLFRYFSNGLLFASTLTTIDNCFFQNINTTHGGGFPVFEIDVYRQADNAPECTVLFRNLTVKDNSVPLNSPIPAEVPSSFFQVITQESTELHLIVQNGSFVNNSASNGIFYSAAQMKTLSFTGCIFRNNRGNFADIFSLVGQPFHQMTIRDSILANDYDSGTFAAFVSSSNRQERFQLNGNSFIRLMRTRNVVISGCQVYGNQKALKGGFLDIQQNSSVSLSNSIARDMLAASSGAILVFVESQLFIRNSSFSRLAALDTGVIQASENSFVNITDSTFHHNAAVTNGVLKISGDSSFMIADSALYNNQAQKNSIGQIIQVTKWGNFSNIVARDNQAWLSDIEAPESEGISLEILACSGLITIDGSTFKDNQAQVKTPNIFLSDAKQVVIRDSIFWNSYQNPVNLQLISGGFINLISSSKLTIRMTQFINGTAYQGGAIFSSGEISIDIENTKFLENQAFKSGGAIHGDSLKSLRMQGNTIFYRNAAAQSGDSLAITNAPLAAILINPATFTSNKVSNFIYINMVRYVAINDAKITLDKNPLLITNKSAGVHLIDVQDFEIERSSFDSLRGSYRLGGGALIIEETQNAMNGQGLIQECTFQNSYSSTSGGGISILNAYNLNVRKSQFLNNFAENQGGALLFSCTDLQKICQLSLDGVLFKNNLANVEGGAVKWNYYEPAMKNVTFTNNTAKIYGDNIASVSRNLVRITKDAVGSKNTSSIERELQGDDSNLRSGGQTSLYFGLVDKYGSFVRVDSKSKLLIKQAQPLDNF